MSPTPATSRSPQLSAVDPIWTSLKDEARTAIAQEPVLGAFLHASVLAHRTLEDAVCHRVARRLDHPDVGAGVMESAFNDLAANDVDLATAFRADIAAVYDRDPACQRYLDVFLYFKGFHALAAHRFAHLMLKSGRRDFALYLQSQSSRNFSVDINPAARIGKGIMIDHSHAIVIGETAVVGDNVSLLHGVTLGGTGKETGDRHPKVGNNVLIGAGAKVLGNISIGDCSRVGAGSVVLKDVPANVTVAGVPAQVIGPAGCPEPARSMDQLFAIDPAAYSDIGSGI
ncbi:MAG: serine O-acetyltransferase [Pseudomonadota bacterium]